MTEDQMALLVNACQASVSSINEMSLAYASVMAGKDDRKNIDKAFAEKDNMLFKFLLNYNED